MGIGGRARARVEYSSGESIYAESFPAHCRSAPSTLPCFQPTFQGVSVNPSKSSSDSVRARAFVIGLVFVVAVCLIVGYSELVASRGGSIDSVLLGASQMPPAAIGMLAALLIANVLLKRFAPKWKLTPAETGAIYIMMICAAMISSFGLTAQLIPSLAGANYFDTPVTGWRAMFFTHFPRWLVPFDPTGPEKQFVTRAYYEGLRAGEKLPWGSWVTPLAAWTAFALLLYFMMACIATLVRKQWVDNEKLSFPLAQLPLEMMTEGASKGRDRTLLWIGALIPFIYHGINGLHNIAPSIPQVPTNIVLNEFFIARPWTDMLYTPIAITFSIVGFAYLLPLDIAFSMWFFPLFFRAQDLLGSFMGYQFEGMPLYPARLYTGYQSIGASVAVVFSMLWLAKPHLKLVFARIFQGMHREIDSDEMMSYRSAFIGATICFALLVVWCTLAGMNTLVAAFLLAAFILLVVVVMSRCVAEMGLLMLQGVFRPMDVWGIGASRLALGPANLAPLCLISSSFMRDPRVLMPVFLDGLKLTDGLKMKRSKLGLALLLAIPVSIVCAYVIHLLIAYKYGAVGLNSWFFVALPQIHWQEASQIIQSHKGFDIACPIWFGVGVLFTIFLYFMRSRFWWWPFHPLGYAIGAAWPGTVWWSAFLIGWFLKSRIIKYGGIKLFRQLRPIFLGMIFGEFFTAFLWAALKALFGWSPPSIPLT